jgi:spore maturation protein CgeB
MLAFGGGSFANLSIGLVSDALTRSCLALECRIIDLTPNNYRTVLQCLKPDFLLVESAWHGFEGSWQFRIASYPSHPWRNNRELRRLVRLAKSLGIPAVFWNKEDGIHFDRFIESARLFDFIFTVDENVVPKYRAAVSAGTVVDTLMFAAQPSIHYPVDVEPRYNRACFMGSYSTHIHDRRRSWQDLLFAASKDLGLTIFDRNSQRPSSIYRYPTLSWMEMRDSVPHDQTAQVYRDYAVSLNVNTIEDSATMFSRRLVEILGTGGLAVTTPALSVDRHFREYCHVVSNAEEAAELLGRIHQHGLTKLDISMAAAGADFIVRYHTWRHRLDQILSVLAGDRRGERASLN